jgi:large subunit ribosomal protein L4
MHQVVKAHLANARQGTASAKNRAAVQGGSRKPWRQKGTGRARQGTIRAAQWEGGGRAFPPIPHSWRQKVPRKVKALARRSAFNARAQEDRIVLIDAPAIGAPRTREIREYLKAVELGGRRVLLLTHGPNEVVYLSARNLPEVEVRPFGEESPYDILRADIVVIERAAIDALAAATPESPDVDDEDGPVSETGAEAEEAGMDQSDA